MSLTEIFAKAGMNTLLGMGIVFLMLIIISCIISLFRFIPEPGKKAVRKTAEEPAESVETGTEGDVLIAVITAAIAAAKAEEQKRAAGSGMLEEEEDTAAYIVRSVKRIRKAQ